MKKTNILRSFALLALAFILSFSSFSSAQAYTTRNRAVVPSVTIDQEYKTGSVIKAIWEFTYNTRSIKELTITEGTLNYSDIRAIAFRLPNLEVLEVSGNARFENDELPITGFTRWGMWGGHPNIRKMSLNVKKIGDSALANCPNLEEVYFPNVTTIDNFAFLDTPKLKKATFGDLQKVGRYAFIRSGYSVER